MRPDEGGPEGRRGHGMAARPAGAAREPGRFLRFQERTSLRLLQEESLLGALASALEEVCVHAGWPVGHALLRPEEGWDGRPRHDRWHLEDLQPFGDFRHASEDGLAAGGVRGDRLLRRVLDARFPAFQAGLGEELHPARRSAAAAAGLRSAYVLPVVAGRRTAALLEFFALEDEPPPRPVLDAVDYVRAHLELVAERERSRRLSRRLERRAHRLEEELGPAVTRLQEMEERYSLLCRGGETGLWDWDLELDRVHYSPRWKAILGYSAVQIGDRPSEWLDRIHPDDRERVRLELREHLDWSRSAFESEHRVLHGDGTYRWVRTRGLALRDGDDQPRRIAGSLADVTEQKTLEERSARDLLYNRLTGLATWPLLVDRLGHTMRRSGRRLDHLFAVVKLELDGLREVTETMGAGAADELLLSLTRRLSVSIRAGDTVAHGRSSHFVVLLDDVQSARDAVRIARRMESALAQPVPLYEEEVLLTPHIGIALGLSRYDRPRELLRDAGTALRQAREREVGIEVFDADASSYDRARTELEADLRSALERGELFLEYQPIVSLEDGRIAGLEAFVRWNHPKKGPIAPERFLSVAGETGLAEDIGYWVLGEACRQLRRWKDALHLDALPAVAINLTETQMFDPDLIGRATAALKGAELDFGLLRFDIAEQAFMSNPPKALHVLTALRARGIRVAIDDFGTGCSSLGYLHRFPVSTLKIDRSFVSGRRGKSRDWEVAETIVRLASFLGLEVIAEGIESREQCVRLRSLGCDRAQGYFFSGPVSAEDAERLIRNGYPLELAPPTA